MTPRTGSVVVLAAALLWTATGAAELLPFEAGEVRRILQHGPWPPAPPRDASNRVSGRPGAIVLGERLFFEPRLSATGATSCASCHRPDRGWTDGLRRAAGVVPLDRNTPGLWNVGHQRWFGWDGAGDSLWAQSIRPILDAREMGASARHVATLIRTDPSLACHYERAFGVSAAAARGDEALLVDAAKALAAFQETLASGRTAFDDFRDALARGDRASAARYPAAAQRGAKIFVGRGNCSVCHFGPAFTNGEFSDVGVPFLVAPGRVDPGRHGGIKLLRASRFNLLGPYSDDASGGAAVRTRHVDLQHRNWGEFKVPSLRNAALTAPYMHDGRYGTLGEVVRHYSELNEERLHADGERILRPLGLGPDEADDLVAFLGTLTDRSPVYARRFDAAACP
ncbi:MAG: cytochrome-c peroxidase [Candidatus Rokuibacteriota bacterium]